MNPDLRLGFVLQRTGTATRHECFLHRVGLPFKLHIFEIQRILRRVGASGTRTAPARPVDQTHRCSAGNLASRHASE